MTVAGLRATIAAQLAAVSAEPMHEARDLLASLHDAPQSWSSMHADDVLTDLLRDRVNDAVTRRLAGAPMAYATQRAAFRHLFLHVDPRVLIPRPETEELVTLALADISDGAVVVDVGTGSGAIALALAQESRAARVVGIDVSRDAVSVAEMNARAVLLPSHAPVTFVHGNLLEPLGGQRIDVLVSNPPYIATTEHDLLPEAVRAWEPALALFGGPDGMAVIRALATQAAAAVAPGGVVLLEVDSQRAGAAAACFPTPAWTDTAVLQDLFGRDRFVRARRAEGPDAGRGIPE